MWVLATEEEAHQDSAKGGVVAYRVGKNGGESKVNRIKKMMNPKSRTPTLDGGIIFYLGPFGKSNFYI